MESPFGLPLARWTSSLLGWIYTLAWGISFYPQVILNFRNKSVRGLSIDFLVLNIIGFICYSVANLALLFSTSVRTEYAERHDGGTPNVRFNDLVFSLHALLLSFITWAQSRWYRREPGQHISAINRYVIILLAVIIVGATALSFGTEYSAEPIYPEPTEELSLGSEERGFLFLDLILALSTIKVYISFAKYVPQAWLNYQRQSTIGWSIANILLDFLGGTLSLAQMVLDAGIENAWPSLTSNPGKLGIALLSIAFDIVFILQHFVLYRDATGPAPLPASVFIENGDPEESDRLIT
ncbi:hypothetical protein CROQUDRAFT_670377 [Cronartium quercuum f. sp. fusiforme G11]|uniref:Cystinosin n=1 Tax=Cronartium quercuum f. sp. fusiforme G11 TaxID=708437 RepID=A0A9P6NKH0_9BASI|nr:hypothetical protein CROQUDRAFT_670377 [Cronartium quercuum f. sp. fusiforme G11]